MSAQTFRGASWPLTTSAGRTVVDLPDLLEEAHRAAALPIADVTVSWSAHHPPAVIVLWSGMRPAAPPDTPDQVRGMAWECHPPLTLTPPEPLSVEDLESAALYAAWRLGAWDLCRVWLAPPVSRLSWRFRPARLGPAREQRDRSLATDGSRMPPLPEWVWQALPPPACGPRNDSLELRLGATGHANRARRRPASAPSLGQVRFAEAIAAWRGEPLPDTARRTRDACSAYISQHEAAFRAAKGDR